MPFLVSPSSPLVSCRQCQRTWNTATMAHGLRAIGSCPRCGGALRFHEDDGAPEADDHAGLEGVPPHLALGRPRSW